MSSRRAGDESAERAAEHGQLSFASLLRGGRLRRLGSPGGSGAAGSPAGTARAKWRTARRLAVGSDGAPGGMPGRGPGPILKEAGRESNGGGRGSGSLAGHAPQPPVAPAIRDSRAFSAAARSRLSAGTADGSMDVMGGGGGGRAAGTRPIRFGRDGATPSARASPARRARAACARTPRRRARARAQYGEVAARGRVRGGRRRDALLEPRRLAAGAR